MGMNRNRAAPALAAALLLVLFSAPASFPQERGNGGFTLDEAYACAFRSNDRITVSRQMLAQEREDIQIAESNLYPRLSAQAAYTRQKVDDISFGGMDVSGLGAPRDYGTLTFRFNQHIYQWGKVWTGREIAKYYYRSSSFRHLRQVREVLFTVSAGYYEVLLGRKAIEIAETALERAKQQLARAEARFEVGVLTQTDVLRARVQVAESREGLARARNQYAIALENLALEVGLEKVPVPLVEPREKRFAGVPVSELYEKALAHRKDLKRLANQLRVAEKRVDFERADYFPNLSLEGQYTLTNETDLFSGDEYDWQAALKLSYPLFTGWQRSAEVDQAKAGVKEVSAAFSRLKREIRNQVRSVYLDIRTQENVIRQLEERVKAARQNYRQVSAQFEQGLVTAVEQVDAFTALNEAENRLAQAYYAYQLDQIRLELATGTFQADLADAEGLLE